MAGCAMFEAGAPEGEVDVIAHRGASAYAPENTLVAFEKAIEMHADWFELDCTMSRDGEIIVIHDDDLERTTDKLGAIRDLTLAEIKQADAGTWFDPRFAGEKVPTLDEALDHAKGRIGVYIEIKDADDDQALRQELLRLGAETGPFYPDHRWEILSRIAEHGTLNFLATLKVLQLVISRNMESQVVIQSFSPIVCAVALAEAPELRTELLASSDDDEPARWQHYLEWLKLLKPHGFNIHRDDVTADLLRELHAKGITMAVWTVNDENDMRRFAEMGVDALISDRPDVALRVTRGNIN